jgi:hypothetical protein
MISIGAMYGGPELERSLSFRLITSVLDATDECTGSSACERDASPAINVVYCVPGTLSSPDWEGVRSAKFSRKQQLLLVQVAVPSELVGSPALKEFLLGSLQKASEVAFEFFRRKRLSFPLAEAKSLVERIRERVDSNLSQLLTDASRREGS